GPQLEGLFSQSALGVVTRVSVPLMPAPELTRMVVLDLADDDQLATAVDVMRGLQLDGTVRAAPWFGNHYRLLSILLRFPWHRTEPPLRPDLAAAIAAASGLTPWTGFTALHGSAAQVGAAQRRVLAALRRVATRVEVVDERSLAAAPVSARRNV